VAVYAGQLRKLSVAASPQEPVDAFRKVAIELLPFVASSFEHPFDGELRNVCTLTSVNRMSHIKSV
jgi:hypothetical protein